MGELRILLGDDHTVLRHGLRKILEERRDCGGRSRNGRDAVREALALTRMSPFSISGCRSERHRGDATDRATGTVRAC